VQVMLYIIYHVLHPSVFVSVIVLVLRSDARQKKEEELYF
jgi:hypothetical protein